MDYIVLGRNGFADPRLQDYAEKLEIEMSMLLRYLRIYHPVPEHLFNICFYSIVIVKSEHIEFGGIAILYSEKKLGEYQKETPGISEEFWDWVDMVKTVDLKPDFLTRIIETRYADSIKRVVFNTDDPVPQDCQKRKNRYKWIAEALQKFR